ncbi:hypothetical protein L1887_18378 [Cichorium endivia]|nr:hypothetical protein L1887_18378 [Cichorium endivia]
MNQTAARRHRLCITDVCGTLGYCDPTYIQSGSVSHRSDIYCFGVVLFEVLCGKKAVMEGNGNRLLAPLAKSHYEGGRLENLIDPNLQKQMLPQSFKIFSETAYCCLNEQRSQRPSIDQIVIKLEKALECQRKYENPVYPLVEGTSKSFKGTNLEHLEILLVKIKKATNNFDEKYLIGSGTYGDVYKAELDHFDCGVKNKGQNWEAKIADFGLSKFHPENQQLNTLYTENIAGTKVYLDPEYDKKGKLKNESDIYSFGVVLFEMLSGRFASDPIYTKENSNGIAPVARRCFNEGTIKGMLDPRLMEEAHENVFSVNKGPKHSSLDAYVKIAYQCVAETQVERPTAEVVIKKLEEALSFQENPKDRVKISLADIKSATQNFSKNCLIGSGGFGSVYKGEVTNTNGCNIIAVKRPMDEDMDEDIDFIMYGDKDLLTKENDIYSFGEVLLEILCGRLVYEYRNGKLQPLLTALFKHHYEEGILGEIVFEGIKEQIVPKSLSSFLMIVCKCLYPERERRPTISEVLLQLKKTLEFQMEDTFGNTMDTTKNREITQKKNKLTASEKMAELRREK